jgi:hypothetical protein
MQGRTAIVPHQKTPIIRSLLKMSLALGDRLGAYEVVSLLDTGGIGEVAVQ